MPGGKRLTPDLPPGTGAGTEAPIVEDYAMIVRGLNRDQLEAAAIDSGVRLVNLRAQNKRGDSFAFTLGLQGELWRRRGWPTLDGRPGRRIAAVCFHGHAAFMQRVFNASPAAVVISKLARFNGVEAFQREACAVGEQNIGSTYRPLYLNEACTCQDPDVSNANQELAEGARI